VLRHHGDGIATPQHNMTTALAYLAKA